ncbi:hypothetical protein VPNG_03411 [Cytospora leucostoma]|uniref:Uncharacterized protein n=1 Tax=Cytospora leucostoma TaxID=1230097 RepID=A0A423XG92_9PEZI|nr:hypothetical protein VPNG_03411 [Cytospora leucostoma]
MALATSPCLYRVRVVHSWRDSTGEDDFNHEAMMELVAGLAPNLKEVQVVNIWADLSMRSLRPRGPWRGLPGFVPGAGLGSLTSLSIVGHLGWQLPALALLLQAWARHTDFSLLRHLDIGGGYNADGGGWGTISGINDEIMEWIVQNCSFPRLRTLGVRLDRDNVRVERPHYTDKAIAFFRAFEPLDELSVAGSLEPEILDAILSRHGPTLHKLSLRPKERPRDVNLGQLPGREAPMIFAKDQILQLQTQCPELQELAIPVKRMKSNALEGEIYRIFRKMERLQFLFLTLDCSDWRVTQHSTSTDDPSFDEYDRGEVDVCLGTRLKRGHLREAFINCAVDEMLARSIWDTICQGKVGKPLESLKLWTKGGGQFGDSGRQSAISEIIDSLSRSWLIERDIGNDENIIIRELGRRAREIRDQERRELDRRAREFFNQQARDDNNPQAPEASDTDPMRVFRRIWPRKEGNKDWREDWAGFPLQV